MNNNGTNVFVHVHYNVTHKEKGFVIMIIMNSNPQTNMLYFEPMRVADYNADMMKGTQLFSGRTYAIKLLHSIFKVDEPLCGSDIQILRNVIKDYPELADEVEERYPHIFK